MFLIVCGAVVLVALVALAVEFWEWCKDDTKGET